MIDIALARNLGCRQMASSNDFGVRFLCFLQAREMSLGNYEHVRGGLGIDVFEGEDVSIFVDFLSGNFSPDHTAKEAISACVSHDLPVSIGRRMRSRGELHSSEFGGSTRPMIPACSIRTGPRDKLRN